jgi:hypothetical protein
MTTSPPLFASSSSSSSKSTYLSQCLNEFLSNSGHFLILKSLADIATYGWWSYLTDPADYLLIAAMVCQTLYLAKFPRSPLLGNLIGVSLYSIIDLPLDRAVFFQELKPLIF